MLEMIKKWRFERALGALQKSPHEALRSFAASDWPARNMPAIDAPMLALDFELDGLTKDAHLLQAGWLECDARSIALSTACGFDIKSDARLKSEAVVIHGIGEQRAAAGRELGYVIDQLIAALSGRVLVAHAAMMERDALRRAVKTLYGADLPIRAICTLTLERRLNPNLVGADAYRLGPCRARYGLPPYAAHDALTDAIAAAELFQAQLSRMPRDTTLSQLEC
ncbi:hypothetical protein EH31_08135 [Erythrobacter longus]|uniref:Exonuclease domain-containing protein n=2 Tax=Erythrobacter longus TaxID=1044 RepID=A0A074MWS6_ERYLO|nr:hypothetical protein EH31_08135 [Erythrobacter longus]